MNAHPLAHVSKAALLTTISVVAIATVAALFVPRLAVSEPLWFLLALLSITVILPPIVYFRNRVDCIDPLFLTSITFLLLFVIRPFYDIYHGKLVWVYLDVSDTYSTALLAALVAVFSFYLFYMLPLGNNIARRYSGSSLAPFGSTVIIGSLCLTILAFALLLLKSILAGGVTTLFAGRSQRTLQGVNVPFISEGFMIALPAFLLLWTVAPPLHRTARLLSIAPLTVLLLGAVPGGERRYILPILAGSFALYCIRHDYRPRLLILMLAGAILVLGFLAPVENSRYGTTGLGESLRQSFRQSRATVTELLESQSTSMLPAVALEVQSVGNGRDIPWQYGLATLTETVLQPIPRQLWSAKPNTIRIQIIEHYWGMDDGACVSQCPTFSGLGTLYADLGMFSIAAGSALLGLLMNFAYSFLLLHPNDQWVQAAYCSCFLLPLFVWWGTLGVVVIYLGLYVIPVLLIALIGNQHRRTEFHY